MACELCQRVSIGAYEAIPFSVCQDWPIKKLTPCLRTKNNTDCSKRLLRLTCVTFLCSQKGAKDGELSAQDDQKLAAHGFLGLKRNFTLLDLER
jgi:hypothetical protein